MSRRGKRRPAPGLPLPFIALVLMLALAACSARATPTQAPAPSPAASTVATTSGSPAAAATPAAAAGNAAAGTPGAAVQTPGAATAPAGAAGTPGATGTKGAAGTPGTAAPSPTPTATLTDVQTRLALAKAYLDGKDYDSATTLYAQIIEDTRGNAEALQGLSAALAGKVSIQATQMAPLATEAPTPVVAPEEETIGTETRSKVSDVLATVIAGLVLIAALYLLAALLRWVLTALRELWYTRVLPWFGRPAIPPGFLIGDFTTPAGVPAEAAARIVPIAMTEKLIAWNQLVQDKQVPVEMAPELDLGPMAWLKVIWNWILPRPRGYRVGGALLAGPAGQHQLAVQRIDLGRNSVDRSRIFESGAQAPAQAYRDMAGEAAKWLIMPADIEAGQAMAMAKGFINERVDTASASDVFDRAIETLLPVRQQMNQGKVDFPDARRRMADAEVMVGQLPANSGLRADLTRVIADLRKDVPGG